LEGEENWRIQEKLIVKIENLRTDLNKEIKKLE